MAKQTSDLWSEAFLESFLAAMDKLTGREERRTSELGESRIYISHVVENKAKIVLDSLTGVMYNVLESQGGLQE